MRGLCPHPTHPSLAYRLPPTCCFFYCPWPPQAGVLPPLLLTLHTTTTPSVAVAVLGVLHNLAMGSEQGKQAVVAAGTLQLLARLVGAQHAEVAGRWGRTLALCFSSSPGLGPEARVGGTLCWVVTGRPLGAVCL